MLGLFLLSCHSFIRLGSLDGRNRREKRKRKRVQSGAPNKLPHLIQYRYGEFLSHCARDTATPLPPPPGHLVNLPAPEKPSPLDSDNGTIPRISSCGLSNTTRWRSTGGVAFGFSTGKSNICCPKDIGLQFAFHPFASPLMAWAPSYGPSIGPSIGPGPTVEALPDATSILVRILRLTSPSTPCA